MFVLLDTLLLCAFKPQSCLAKDMLSRDRLLGDDKTPWQITARSLIYKDKGVIVAEGDVVITKGGQSLYAQKAVYNTNTRIAELSEDVRFEFGGDILTGEQGIFDLENQTGKITKGSLFLSENHYYISGDVMEKTGENSYLVKNCELTTCDGIKPAWSITGSELKVTVEGYGTVKHAAFRVRGIPLLYVPYMIFPAKTNRQSGLLPPRFGYSSRNGFEAEVPFFWAISDQTDATFYQRYISRRGYMQGLEFRYLLDEDSGGDFEFDIMSDKEEKDLSNPEDVEISPFPRSNDTRYWFKGKADQALPLGFEARLDADYVSDQDYLREFQEGLYGFGARPDLVKEFGRPLEEKRSPFRTSNFRLSRDHDDYSLQALATYHQRPEDPSDDQTAQPLGGLNFILLPEQVMNFPMFFSLNSDYDYVWREEGQKGHRASVSPGLRFPLWLGPYLEFEPSFRYTYNVQWLDEDTESADRQYKRVYEAGATLLTSLERVYDFNWWGAKRLKHQIRPAISYTYRVPQDEEEESPWFEPVDVDGKINRVAFSLENYMDARLENKKGGVEYRQWVNLTLTQGYDIEEAMRDREPGERRRPFEPLNATMRVQPFANIDFLGQVEWDHYDHEITFANLSLNASIKRSGGIKDRFKIDYQFEESGQESLKTSIEVNLVYGFSTGASLEKDLGLNENISNSFWLGYDSQCWGTKIVTERTNDDTTVMLLFNLLGLGDIKAF
jgi:LPS-assembly protein